MQIYIYIHNYICINMRVFYYFVDCVYAYLTVTETEHLLVSAVVIGVNFVHLIASLSDRLKRVYLRWKTHFVPFSSSGKMRSTVTFGLLCLCACLSSSNSQQTGPSLKRRGYESPEQAVLYPILSRLAYLRNWVFGRFWELDESVWSQEARDGFLDVLDEMADEKEDGCIACTVWF